LTGEGDSRQVAAAAEVGGGNGGRWRWLTRMQWPGVESELERRASGGGLTRAG